jgi:magnesium-transporting ATPase (P-type)
MELNCQNCNQIISDNFCGNCGQKKYKRIDKKYIWDEIQYTFLHTNKGFLYSVKNILKNPGKTAKEFIDGNRVNHYKPILLAFVLSGISAFISFKIIGLNEIMANYYAEKHINSPFMNDYMTITSSYNSIIMLLLIPFFAFFTKLAFRKWGHNYYEHIVMNSYVLCFYTLFSIFLVYPLMLLFKNNIDILISLASLSMLFIPFILTWFFKDLYSDKPLKSVIGRVGLTIGLMILGFVVLMILIMIGGFIYAMTKGPEALEYMKPK